MVDRSNGGIISGNCIPINNSMDLPCRQVGEDVVDFGIPLGKVIKIAVPRYSSQEPTLLAPIGQRCRSNTVSDNCELDYTPRLQRLALCESVVDISSQSNSEDGRYRDQ